MSIPGRFFLYETIIAQANLLSLRPKNGLQVSSHCMSKAAEMYPHAAFATLSKSLQFDWTYLQRVVPICGADFALIWDALNQYFWPTVFVGAISKTEIVIIIHTPCLDGWYAWECTIQLKQLVVLI